MITITFNYLNRPSAWRGCGRFKTEHANTKLILNLKTMLKSKKQNPQSCQTDVISRYPWVFWIRFKKRDWFCNFWKSRGSNCLDIQIFKLHISIGMPWHKEVLRKADANYPMEGLNHFRKANETFTKWYHFHIGSYNGL